MNKRGVPGPELIMWLVIGLVILAGLVFAVRAAIGQTSNVECTGGFLECEDPEEDIPIPADTPEQTTLSFEVNNASANSNVELFEGRLNTIKVAGFESNNCQAVILLDGAIYRESGSAIIAEGRCSNSLILEFASLKRYQDNNIELDVVVYKPGVSGLYHEKKALK